MCRARIMLTSCRLMRLQLLGGIIFLGHRIGESSLEKNISLIHDPPFHK